MRFDNWKFVFLEQRCPGTLQVWAEPFTELRVPKIFNLKTDPYERADITSNTYYDWLISHAYLVVPAQTLRHGDGVDARRVPTAPGVGELHRGQDARQVASRHREFMTAAGDSEARPSGRLRVAARRHVPDGFRPALSGRGAASTAWRSGRSRCARRPSPTRPSRRSSRRPATGPLPNGRSTRPTSPARRRRTSSPVRSSSR